jgi:hypothetical protein
MKLVCSREKLRLPTNQTSKTTLEVILACEMQVLTTDPEASLRTWMHMKVHTYIDLEQPGTPAV